MTLVSEGPRAPRGGIGFLEFVLLIAAMMALGALGIDAMLPNVPAIGAFQHRGGGASTGLRR